MILIWFRYGFCYGFDMVDFMVFYGWKVLLLTFMILNMILIWFESASKKWIWFSYDFVMVLNCFLKTDMKNLWWKRALLDLFEYQYDFHMVWKCFQKKWIWFSYGFLTVQEKRWKHGLPMSLPKDLEASWPYGFMAYPCHPHKHMETPMVNFMVWKHFRRKI